jgi:hypothetical protein
MEGIQMVSRVFLGLSVVGVLFGVLLGKSFWEKKPYTEWSRRDVARTLLDSPWADAETFDLRGLDSSGISGAQRRYYIRFHSALPIRMALARNAVLEDRITTEQAQQFVDEHPAPGYVVIGLSVATGQSRAELTRLTTERLKQRTYLQLKGSGKRIYLERYENPNEVGGGEAYLYFPRMLDGQDSFDLEEKEVRFNCEVDPDTWINLPFKLDKMVFNGELEI